MSLSQLSGKQGINYAKLRQKRSPNDSQSFGYHDSMKYQRAKSTLQHNHRHGTADIDDYEGDKLFDQFFKLNNSRSDSDFLRESMQRDAKTQESDFLKFVENALEYHKQSEIRSQRPTQKKQSYHYEQQLKEAEISNRLLANELNRYRQKEIEMKIKIKGIQKEHQQLQQKCRWLEELLAKQKIDNENSLLAVKKTVEMLQIRCKCQKGYQLDDKKDIKSSHRYDIPQTQSSSQLSSNTEEEDYNQFNYSENPHFRRRSLSKTSEEHQEHLVQSFSQGKHKNPREFQKDLFLRKKPLQDPYYIEEENTNNSM